MTDAPYCNECRTTMTPISPDPTPGVEAPTGLWECRPCDERFEALRANIPPPSPVRPHHRPIGIAGVPLTGERVPRYASPTLQPTELDDLMDIPNDASLFDGPPFRYGSSPDIGEQLRAQGFGPPRHQRDVRDRRGRRLYRPPTLGTRLMVRLVQWAIDYGELGLDVMYAKKHDLMRRMGFLSDDDLECHMPEWRRTRSLHEEYGVHVDDDTDRNWAAVEIEREVGDGIFRSKPGI